MTEKSELNLSSISKISNSNETIYSLSNLDKDEMNHYPIRCNDCSKIAILNADFKNNKFITKCDGNHKTEYNSFHDFLSQSNKDIYSFLCKGCQKNRNEADLYKCKICETFFCGNCKNEHIENNRHTDYIEIKKIDNYCEEHDKKFEYFHNKQNVHLCENCLNNYKDKNNIIEIKNICNKKNQLINEYQKTKENISIVKKNIKAINNWLKELTKKVNIYCETLNNYFYIQNSILGFIKDSKNNNDLYDTNLNVIINYETFNKNKNNIDMFIEKINKINNLDDRNTNFENNCNNFCQILKNFDEIKFDINGEETKDEIIKNYFKNLDEKIKEDKKREEAKKIEYMDALKVKLDSEAKCFCKLNDEKCIVVGKKSGGIEIMEIKDTGFKTKLIINEFYKEIAHIRELDENLFVATDGTRSIKIFQLSEDLKRYSLIQTIDLKYNSEYIYTLINLPILSSNKKRHYFCTGDENHIFIWKSNKQPKKMISKEINSVEEESDETSEDISLHSSNSEESYKSNASNDDEPLIFTEIKDIELYTPISCLAEVNEKYIAAVCRNERSIKFFDVKNFEEVKEIENINVSYGSNILVSLRKLNILIVGCQKGFILISTKSFKKKKLIEANYSVTCLEVYNKDKNIILCGCKERNENKIKQYQIDDYNYLFEKFSEKSIKENEVWNIKNINKNIFYTKSNKYLYYFR